MVNNGENQREACPCIDSTRMMRAASHWYRTGEAGTMQIRSRHLIIADTVAIILAFTLSFVLRFENADAWSQYFWQYLWLLPVLVATNLGALYLSGLYRRLWRYASTPEAITIVRALTISAAGTTALVLLVAWSPLAVEYSLGFPRSILAIDWLLSIALIGTIRFGARLFEESHSTRRSAPLKRPADSERRVLIVGAGDAGVLIAREMRTNPGLGLRPVGFIDDDPAKQGLEILGLRVLGRCDGLLPIVQSAVIDEVIIAMPTAAGRKIRQIIQICQDAAVSCRTIPGIYELIDGRVSLAEARDIRIEDLLRREPVHLDTDVVLAAFAGRALMITGGGGSIGSELARQLAACQPARLILFGHGENSIFEITNELRARFPDIPVVPIIGSICDRVRVAAVLRAHRPDAIFHAAAHKHVGLMEENPSEAVRNNVFGTRIVAEEAARHAVQRFVHISTDKAVRPSNVMGATKHLAELLVRDLADRSDTIFTAVRFGNVLGSRGSLVPILKRQIAAGGPVTVTDPEVTRYFMTIPEAAKLVIHAAARATGGEIYVLDMGEPVKILDLAHDLIRLSGLRPNEDIEVRFTGLKAGEKLHETLVGQDEDLTPSGIPGLLTVRCGPVEEVELRANLATLGRLIERGDDARITDALKTAATSPATTASAHSNGSRTLHRVAMTNSGVPSAENGHAGTAASLT